MPNSVQPHLIHLLLISLLLHPNPASAQTNPNKSGSNLLLPPIPDEAKNLGQIVPVLRPIIPDNGPDRPDRPDSTSNRRPDSGRNQEVKIPVANRPNMNIRSTTKGANSLTGTITFTPFDDDQSASSKNTAGQAASSKNGPDQSASSIGNRPDQSPSSNKDRLNTSQNYVKSRQSNGNGGGEEKQTTQGEVRKVVRAGLGGNEKPNDKPKPNTTPAPPG